MLIGTLTCAATVVSGAVFADGGLRDGEDYFSHFSSSKSSADVSAEFDAAQADGMVSYGENDTFSNRDSNIGARGPAGSRFSTLTREEVVADLIEHQASQDRNPNSDIYYGN